MNRRFLGPVAYINRPTVDGRALLPVAVSRMAPKGRRIPVREKGWNDIVRPDHVGAVGSFVVVGTGVLVASGYVGMGRLSPDLKAHLEEGAAVQAGISLAPHHYEVELSSDGLLKMAEWSISELVIGLDYQDAWDIGCWIQLEGQWA
jgi:hypothetical protein